VGRDRFAAATESTIATFQQGVSGYTGAQDTYLAQAAPNTVEGALLNWRWDTENPSPSQEFGLIRFDGIFGSGPGQIPAGSTIVSASLILVSDNSTATPAGAVNEAAVDWSTSTATWNNFGGEAGVQADEYRTSPAYVAPLFTGATASTLITESVNVTASLQSWLTNPSLNFGWVFRPNSNDGAVVFSSEASTIAYHPTLTVEYDPPPCVNDGNCNDANACTTDTCNVGNGTCSHTPMTCAWGTCSSTSGTCEVALTFQDGLLGYSGTKDTYLEEAAPGTSHANDASFFMDNSPNKQGLLRFDGIFGGNGTSQIPPGSTIRSAMLTVNVNDASDTGAALHRMLACWEDTNTWSTFGAGIQADGIEAVATADTTGLLNTTGTYDFTVTNSVTAWSAGALNLGWALLPLGGSGWGLDSAQGTTKPKLVVTFTPPSACSTDANCNDANGCSTDTCNVSTGFCSHAANPGGSCTDGIACTTDTCSACGRCASADGCTPPAVCNTGNGQCEASPSPPSQPTNPSPASGATGVSTSPQLCVEVSDPNGGTLDVTFHGREVTTVGAGVPFTLVVLPDTQFYACGTGCDINFTGNGSIGPAIFNSQTQWVVDNRVARNIVFVTQLGDCVEHGNEGNDPDGTGSSPTDPDIEWVRANAAFSILENPTTTTLADGIPYGIAAGNHDQTNIGTTRNGSDEGGADGVTFTGTTKLYNQYFGRHRFCPGGTCRGYVGDNYEFGNPTLYSDSMDNHYELFSAGGMDFIIIHFEWDQSANASRTAVLAWADAVLTTYSNRRAILVSHYFLDGGGTLPTGPWAGFSNQGQAVYDALKTHPNLFLMLSGHIPSPSEGIRRETRAGMDPVYAVMSDYQGREEGGNGRLRIMEFRPNDDEIRVFTYSPYMSPPAGTFETGPEDQFTLPYSMDPGLPYTTIGTNNAVASGSQTCMSWPGLLSGQQYEWYVSVSDGTSTTTGPSYTFTTSNCTVDADCNDSDACTADTCVSGACSHAAVGGCCNTHAQCDDSNACTTDTCQGDHTCSHANNTASCSDGNACTTNDACSVGSCVGGAAPNCDDGNVCTNDSCVAPTGCAHANNTASCNDGNACTTPDACSGGACGGTYSPTAGCCTISANCNDGNPATTDTCSGGTCSNTAVTSCTTSAECNDGDVCTTDTCNGSNIAALDFDGTNDFVTMQAAAGLGAATFTLETWFKRTDVGTGNTTGTNGIASLVPLVTKGGPEEDASNKDANYILGINTSGNVLAADFEDTATGSNHPISGATAISLNVWHHAAATYDGTTWRLYLDGNLDGTLAVGAFTPRSDSIQHFGLGAMLSSAGARLGAPNDAATAPLAARSGPGGGGRQYLRRSGAAGGCDGTPAAGHRRHALTARRGIVRPGATPRTGHDRAATGQRRPATDSGDPPARSGHGLGTADRPLVRRGDRADRGSHRHRPLVPPRLAGRSAALGAAPRSPGPVRPASVAQHQPDRRPTPDHRVVRHPLAGRSHLPRAPRSPRRRDPAPVVGQSHPAHHSGPARFVLPRHSLDA
jgi:hypothetical protein